MHSCFRAYDIRGKASELLANGLSYYLGVSIRNLLKVRRVVLGRDIRHSSQSLRTSIIEGLKSEEVMIYDLGVCGTEELYYAIANYDFDLGIMITGSHNPIDENGFKLIGKKAKPLSPISGLLNLQAFVEKKISEPTFFQQYQAAESVRHIAVRQKYINFLLNYSGTLSLAPKKNLKIVFDAGNGGAGSILRQILPRLPFECVLLNFEPDPNFTNGVPNPLLKSRRKMTAESVRSNQADLGVAFDGDFDRCFFYDNAGNFIEGYYCVALLAQELLRKWPGSTIVHDNRVYWNTQEVVRNSGGKPLVSRTGHAFMKESMRVNNAVYGGEMSGHHYFREFAFCDSGMLPWLLLVNLLQHKSQTLAELVNERISAYPCSGEINLKVNDAHKLLKDVEAHYAGKAEHIDHLDGLNVEYEYWRFNIRVSNTEDLVRLNMETRGDKDLLSEKNNELIDFCTDRGVKIV